MGEMGYLERNEGIERIVAYLAKRKPEEECALCLVDIDNFRGINESFGYSYGNLVLTDICDIIVAEKKENDIVVKLGSDEFAFFITNTSRKDVTYRTNVIYENIHGVSSKVEVGCSIGITSTVKADNYDELYEQADKVLDIIKRYGKDSVAWYVEFTGKMNQMLDEGKLSEDQISELIDLSTIVNNDNIISFAMRIFERMEDVRAALYIVFERLAREMNMRRVIIDEIENRTLNSTVSYMWSRENKYRESSRAGFIINQRALEEFLSFVDLNGQLDMSLIDIKHVEDNNKMYYEHAKRYSQLYDCIHDRGKFSGVIIYEHMEPNYVWDFEDRKILKAISKVIAIYISRVNYDVASKAKSEFLSKMSHDIRTPMNAIIGMTAIGKTVSEDPEKVLDCFNKIENSAKYLLSIVNDILDMSKIESGKMVINKEVFDLNKSLDEINELFRDQMKSKQIDFVISADINNNILYGDQVKLNQVLINLIGNAYKFTSRYGRIEVIVTQIMQETDKAGFKFSVKDTGIGIEKAKLKKIFNAFEQANGDISHQYGGSGLGLAICESIVHLMGGTIGVESEKGVGSEFTFEVSFDVGPDRIESVEYEEEEETEEYDFNGKTILLVEDNELNAEVATAILEMVGCKIEHVENGKKAVFKFAEMETGHYDLILMDIRMPVMDGFEATKYIREMGKKDSKTIPIIAMTANAFDDDMEKSINSGMNGHLSKPIDIKKLYYELSKIL